ncbi:MAG: glycosyltransferase [Bacteroidia bacterium]|nr:glycosyltransferase [Bacteroidia bacterium]
MERFYSFIVPVYNRPGEVAELLESFAVQTFTNFEAVIVEDGSDLRSEDLVEEYSGKLNIRYVDLPRSGPSLARNAGTRVAKGDYYIYVDSDCILPAGYLKTVDRFLENHPLDFFGGPDRASDNFNRTQKAISYAMTSFLTTGGIRGGKRKIDRFYPRSFNMGISRKAFEVVGGYPETRMHPGEDMVLSIELINNGFTSGLIGDAYVYHKRRTTLGRFFKQVFGFGKSRYIISKVYPETFNLFYLVPSLFLAGFDVLLALGILFGSWFLLPVVLWVVMVFLDATVRNGSPVTGLIAAIASFIQLYGYGSGFLSAWWSVSIRGKDQYGVLTKGFYPDRQQSNQSRF